VLDQMGDAPRRPQPGLIAQSLRPALESLLDAPQILGTQTRAAPGASRLPQRPPAAPLQLLDPPAHRLPMYSDSPGHFRLMNALAKQIGRLQTTLL
jgi:hypothetical protein